MHAHTAPECSGAQKGTDTMKTYHGRSVRRTDQIGPAKFHTHTVQLEVTVFESIGPGGHAYELMPRWGRSFGWGSGSGGSARGELAYRLLEDCLGEDAALDHWERFCETIAALETANWTMTEDEIRRWHAKAVEELEAWRNRHTEVTT